MAMAVRMTQVERFTLGLIDEDQLTDFTPPTVLSLGMGINSVAIICGMIERRERAPDAILFADTGGEKKRTYAYIAILNAFLRKHGWPEVTIVRKGGNGETLEENCRRKNMLPSLAYGRKGCSQKFKVGPQEVWGNKRYRRYFKAGGMVDKLLGYDFKETRRWMKAKLEDGKYFYRFPLVEWEWDRAACIAAILRAGLPLPGKSACFFCPASTLDDIEHLRVNDPDQFKRAIRMEFDSRMNLKTIYGLGRRFSWIEHILKSSISREEALKTLGLTEAEVVAFVGRRVIPIKAANDDNIEACSYCVDFEDAA
jgi:hypothetical protein